LRYSGNEEFFSDTPQSCCGVVHFSIETIAAVLAHNYGQFKANYNSYEIALFERFGCDFEGKEDWIVEDINAGITEKIYGHLLSYYNTGKDCIYRDKKTNEALRNNAGITYANFTREYLLVLRDILFDPQTVHFYWLQG
jgi:hypothetical protein